jgi:hypothetical protein
MKSLKIFLTLCCLGVLLWIPTVVKADNREDPPLEIKCHLDMMNSTNQWNAKTDFYRNGVLQSYPASNKNNSAYPFWGAFFGTDYLYGRLKMGFEVGTGQVYEANSNQNFDSLSCKGGYRVFQWGPNTLDLTLSYLNFSVTENGNSFYRLNGILVGTDINYFISRKVFIEGSINRSVLASPSVPSIDQVLESNSMDNDISKKASMFWYRCTVNYLLIDNMALSIGYRSIENTLNYSANGSNTKINITDQDKYGGFFLSIIFNEKF